MCCGVPCPCCCSRLLAAGADANACDYDARCALHIAAAEGNLPAVKVLVEQGGAELGLKDRWGLGSRSHAWSQSERPVQGSDCEWM